MSKLDTSDLINENRIRKIRSLLTDAAKETGNTAKEATGELATELVSIEDAIDVLRRRLFNIQ